MKRITCNRCGTAVSSPVPDGTVVRGWVECIECIEKMPDLLETLKAVYEEYGEAHSKSTEREKIGRIIALAERRNYEPEKPPRKS
ncbi:MAG: hypothetical protein KAR06_04120 [Deltaproteobacteria bacterium]|nr:hypothetical protein [Deltaproteobacteria bacterium]